MPSIKNLRAMVREKGRIVLWLESLTSDDVDTAVQVRIWSNFAISISTHGERILPRIHRTVSDKCTGRSLS